MNVKDFLERGRAAQQAADELATGGRPSGDDFCSAIDALRVAAAEARCDGARAATGGDTQGAADHRARAKRLLRVVHWLERTE